MAGMPHDQKSGRDTGDDDGPAGPRGTTPATPRWVKVSAIIVAIAVVLIVVMLLAGGSSHGPGRHLGGNAPPASAAPLATHAQPPGLARHDKQSP